MATIDHLILSVNDVAASVDFYVNILGFEHGGKEGPFTVIRVSQDFILQLAPWGTDGNEHLAFALSRKAFG
jgi:catechol 2,3-dioxygenase-like lactoylglutathione lyase family enzyme